MKYISYLFLIVMAWMLCACNADTDKGTPAPDNIVYDFATFVSTTKEGSVFSLRKANDSPLAEYYCSYSLYDNKEITPGMRVLIGYTCDGHQPYTTGEITLYGVRMLNNTDQNLQGGYAVDNDNWLSNDVDMQIITRTGQYINMQLGIYGTTNVQLKRLDLVVDSTTVDQPYPTLHLMCVTNNKGENPYTAFASYDISSIWDVETVKGVNILYQTTGGTKSTQFSKPNTSITPVE